MSVVAKSTSRPALEEADPLLGRVLNGKFKVLSNLDQGGMGKIYRAEQIPLGRPVAIKVLNPAYTNSSSDPAFQKRFFLEAAVMAKLQHPNLVTVFDYGLVDGLETDTYYMAMEFISGETLAQRVKRTGPLEPAEALRIVREVGRGLREAHRNGVVHRDLKPSNIMLMQEEGGAQLVKILDFGLVKVLDTDAEEITRDNTIRGSPRYMAPEVILQHGCDLRADIYAVGVILYEIVCGRVPFSGSSSVQIMMAHVKEPVPSFVDRVPGAFIPDPLDRLVRHCLEKDPQKRPSSADELLKEIRVCEKELGIASDGSSPSQSGVHSLNKSRSVVTRAIEPPGGADPETTLPAEVSPVSQPSAKTPFPQPPPRRFPVGLLAGGAFVVGLVAIVGVYLAVTRLGNDPVPLPPVGPAAGAAGAPAQPDAPPPVEPKPAEPASYLLVIRSTPAGAEVLDGEKRLGMTPLDLPVENAAVREHPRELTLRLEGYEPATVVEGPGSGTVVVPVALAAIEPEPKDPGEEKSPTKKKKDRKKPPKQDADTDIRLER